MNKFYQTLAEVSESFSKNKIEFVLTRFNPKKECPADIDVLVKTMDFTKAISSLEEAGYKSFSHDRALGGRIKGAQVNLVKPGRIKIDLHKDFTWRKTRYFELSLIWDNLEERVISGIKVKVPTTKIDVFIVAVNIIFEKTYITREDHDYLGKRSKDLDEPVFRKQAKKYEWEKTHKRFIKWWQSKGQDTQDFPLFLPVTLVLYSYLEKFDLIAFFYYFFFRIRHLVNKKLPYE